MLSCRITVSLPDPIARRLRKAAGQRPVSTWLAELIEEHLNERELEEKWLAFYEGVHPNSGHERRASQILKRATRRKKVA